MCLALGVILINHKLLATLCTVHLVLLHVANDRRVIVTNYARTGKNHKEGPEGVKRKLGLTYFLAGKMGFGLPGLGFGQ